MSEPVDKIVEQEDRATSSGAVEPAPAPRTTSDLDAIEALCEAATPGPWVALSALDGSVLVGGDEDHMKPVFAPPRVQRHWLDDLGRRCRATVARCEGPSGGADADFIAAAREAIPALIARIRKLETESEGWANR